MRIGIDADVVAEVREATAGAVMILNNATLSQAGHGRQCQARHCDRERCQCPLHRLSRMPQYDSLYSPVEHSSRDLVLFTFRSRARHMSIYSRCY